MTNGQADPTCQPRALGTAELEAVEDLVAAAEAICEWARVARSLLRHHIECRPGPELDDGLDALIGQLDRTRCWVEAALEDVAAALEHGLEAHPDAPAAPEQTH